MVRTRADNGMRKAIGAKVSNPKSLGGGGSGGGSSSQGQSPRGGKAVSKYAGGNTVCDRPTPEWQKGIGGFLVKKPASSADDNNHEIKQELGEPSGSCEDFPATQDEGCSSAGVEAEGTNFKTSQCSRTSEGSAEDEPGSPASGPSVARNGIIDSDEDD